MAVTVIELNDSREFGVGFTDGDGRRSFIVRCTGESDPITAITLAVAAEAPFYWNNMSRQRFNTTNLRGDLYRVEVPYSYSAGGGDGAGSGSTGGNAPDPTQPPGPPGSGPGGSDPSSPPSGPSNENERMRSNASIEIGGKPPRLYRSRGTHARGRISGLPAPDMGGSLVVADGKVEGVDVPDPDVILTQEFTFDYVTWLYVGLLKSLVWHTNDRPWYTFPRYDVAFLGASLRSDDQGRVAATMKFGLSSTTVVAADEIRLGLPAEAVDVPGWHWLWFLYRKEEDADAGLNAERPWAYYVDQLLPTADLRLLGVGG